MPDEGGRVCETDFLGGAPAAFAGDQFKGIENWPNDKRLNNAALPDGIDQFGERFTLEIPGAVGAGSGRCWRG